MDRIGRAEAHIFRMDDIRPLNRRNANTGRFRRLAVASLASMMLPVLAWWTGCAGPAPQLFPPALQAQTGGSDAGLERLYDCDGDGESDYAELLGTAGRVALMKFDEDGDGELEYTAQPPRLRESVSRHLIIILDSIPYDLVRQEWDAGRFAHFNAPSRVISPFPVMTDPSLTEFFGLSPCNSVEAQYFDGTALNNGYGTYLSMENSPWTQTVDYHMKFIGHLPTYLWPRAWFDHELRRIQDIFMKDKDARTIGYAVGTSALGARIGREGHLIGLARLDRFCQWIIHQLKGDVHITLLSDHGHNLVPSRRIDLAGALRGRGHKVSKRLDRAADVVIPAFGIVTCAAIHTKRPAAVANDAAAVEGIDLAAYLDRDGEVVVLNDGGRARITHREGSYAYHAEEGDPLELIPILDALEKAGSVDADGFVYDRVLFQATSGHEYPDPLHRIWRAFHGLFENTPDVLLSVKDGYHCGSRFMTDVITLRAAHGSLNRTSSSGFVMSTAGSVAQVIRMENLREALMELGVPVTEDGARESVQGLAIEAAPPAAGNGIVK